MEVGERMVAAIGEARVVAKAIGERMVARVRMVERVVGRAIGERMVRVIGVRMVVARMVVARMVAGQRCRQHQSRTVVVGKTMLMTRGRVENGRMMMAAENGR